MLSKVEIKQDARSDEHHKLFELHARVDRKEVTPITLTEQELVDLQKGIPLLLSGEIKTFEVRQ